MIIGTIIGGDESFRRQETRDRYPPLPSTPPLLVLYFYHILLLGVSVCVCYYWESMVLSVSSIPLYIVYDSSGGVFVFIKIFVEANKRELSKTENK